MPNEVYEVIHNAGLDREAMPSEMRTGADRTIITANATTQIKGSAGKVGQIIVWDAGTGWQIDVYDHASANSNQVWSWVTADGKGVYALQVPMDNGIRVVTSGTTPGKCTVVWS